jgi:Arc/MetJ-type ribon-helix-helix transcriptional regulator
MRNIINISMPASTKKEMEAYAKEGQYASVSEFIRNVYREWKEDRLLASLRESQKEIREGKGKILHSLRDLR